MTDLPGYPEVHNLGRPEVVDLFRGPVLIEEKIDGSQISFGRFGDELRVRSRGKRLDLAAPEKMFVPAVESIKARFGALPDGWTVRGEYLAKPKHNVLAYDRVPRDHIILFDVEPGGGEYLRAEQKALFSRGIGYECVPVLFHGVIEASRDLFSFLESDSILGGVKVEGLVIKNYTQPAGIMFGKFVSERFRESAWGKPREGGQTGDILSRLRGRYAHTRRWEKAVERLRDAGELTQTPTDIGALIPAVKADIEKECMGEITSELLAWAMPKILSASTVGLADWYKRRLVENQFNGGGA